MYAHTLEEARVMPGPWDLESHTVVNCLLWVLGIKTKPCARIIYILNCESPSQHLTGSFNFQFDIPRLSSEESLNEESFRPDWPVDI